jgi:hypothetical protein
MTHEEAIEAAVNAVNGEVSEEGAYRILASYLAARGMSILKDMNDWDTGPRALRQSLIPSETDEGLMLKNMIACADPRTQALRVSVEHYRYLAGQIILIILYWRIGCD